MQSGSGDRDAHSALSPEANHCITAVTLVVPLCGRGKGAVASGAERLVSRWGEQCVLARDSSCIYTYERSDRAKHTLGGVGER